MPRTPPARTFAVQAPSGSNLYIAEQVRCGDGRGGVGGGAREHGLDQRNVHKQRNGRRQSLVVGKNRERPREAQQEEQTQSLISL